MSDTWNKVTIRKTDRHVQKIRSLNETERNETGGYKDNMGDDMRNLVESDDNT